MESRARITLDSPLLRARLRKDFDQVEYLHRPIPSIKSRTVQNINSSNTKLTTEKYSANIPKPSTSAPNKTVRELLDELFTGDHSKAIDPKLRYVNENSEKDSSTNSRFRNTIYNFKNLITNHYKYGVYTLIVSVVLFGAYLTYIGFKSNIVSQHQAQKLTAMANHAAKSNTPSSSVISTVKPSNYSLANYAVAPNLPKFIIIPKLGVNARIFSVGVNASGALITPNNVFDTDWYNESALPGQPGAMLIDGHISSWTAHGVFYGLNTLKPGDQIKIERGDGTIFTYSVVTTKIFNANNVNMQSAITPVNSTKPGLNLISCSGDVIPGTSEFNERIIVYSSLVN